MKLRLIAGFCAGSVLVVGGALPVLAQEMPDPGAAGPGPVDPGPAAESPEPAPPPMPAASEPYAGEAVEPRAPVAPTDRGTSIAEEQVEVVEPVVPAPAPAPIAPRVDAQGNDAHGHDAPLGADSVGRTRPDAFHGADAAGTEADSQSPVLPAILVSLTALLLIGGFWPRKERPLSSASE